MTAEINDESVLDDISDVDIAYTSALAALEADSLIRHEQTSLENLKRISMFLSRGASLVKIQDHRVLSLASPTTIDALKTAFDASNEYPIQSLQELVQKTSDLSNKLNDLERSGGNDDGFYKSLRDFCVALSEYTLATKDSVFSDNGPKYGSIY